MFMTARIPLSRVRLVGRVDGLVDAGACVWRELVTATCAPRREITSRRPALRHADLFSYFKLGLHAASANARALQFCVLSQNYQATTGKQGIYFCNLKLIFILDKSSNFVVQKRNFILN